MAAGVQGQDSPGETRLLAAPWDSVELTCMALVLTHLFLFAAEQLFLALSGGSGLSGPEAPVLTQIQISPLGKELSSVWMYFPNAFWIPSTHLLGTQGKSMGEEGPLRSANGGALWSLGEASQLSECSLDPAAAIPQEKVLVMPILRPQR